MEGSVEQVDRGTFFFRVPADQLASRRIRRHLESLDFEFEPEVVELLKLVATELVTNSVIHAATSLSSDEIAIFVRVTEPTLLLKVCDQGPGVDTSVRQADVMAEGGRGLFLVDALTHSWGTSEVEIDGKPWSCVWACFGEKALPCSDGGAF